MSSIPEMGALKWRDTGRSLRFIGIDGRALFLFCIFLYYPHVWTLFVFLVGVAVLVLLERMGYSIPNGLRRLRVILVGRERPSVTATRAGRCDR